MGLLKSTTTFHQEGTLLTGDSKGERGKICSGRISRTSSDLWSGAKDGTVLGVEKKNRKADKGREG